MIPAVLLLLSTTSIACKAIILHPIEKQDIVIMMKDVSYTPDRDGYFLSHLYMEEVLQAKVENIKK